MLERFSLKRVNLKFWDLSTNLYAYFYKVVWSSCGLGSSVNIVTDYGLDGPGLNPGGDEIFCSSRPAMRPIQPPAKWALGLSQG